MAVNASATGQTRATMVGSRRVTALISAFSTLTLSIVTCGLPIVGVGFRLLEIKGVDGNLWPVVGLRWSGAIR